MGEILKDLVRIELPDREPHNSRMFIDLCENIHIHYREFRIVFSLNEYFEFADIMNKSTLDVRNYLAQNDQYKEMTYPTTLMVASGKIRQKKLLQNSPRPNSSFYFPNVFAIELQTERVTDEIHVHWRDYRLALPREHFKIIAQAFQDANESLKEFEEQNNYIRKEHSDRKIEDFEQERAKYADSYDGIIDEKMKNLDEIKFSPNLDRKKYSLQNPFMKELVDLYQRKEYIFPILLSTESDGSHRIIDGHHRYFAAKASGLVEINCIISEINFEQSEYFRKAESLLKKFDFDTNYKFHTSNFMREYFAFRMGKRYRDHFSGKVFPNLKDRFLNFARKIKKIL